jgi:hypothetical protein
VPDDLFVSVDAGLGEGAMVGEQRIQREHGVGAFGGGYEGWYETNPSAST